MRPSSQKAVVLASVVHLLFAALLLVFTIWSPPERKKDPVVLTLHAAPAPPQPEPDLPSVAFVYEPPPPPPPAPPPEPTPKPKPPPPEPAPKPKPPPPEPAPKPKPPPPPPEPERVTFDQHRQKNPLPKQRAPNPPSPAPVTAPRIDTTKITRTLESMMSRETAAQVSEQSPSDQAALSAYFERVKAAVRGAWAKPDGLNDQLRVSVSFQLSADGRISGARVSSSSGNSIYDQSVLEAFARAGSVGPTPDRKAYPLRLEFRMTD